MSEKTVVRHSPLKIPGIIRAHWNSDPKEPLNLMGEPSTVKSASVYQESRRIADDIGREFVDWNQTPLDKKKEVEQNPSRYFVYGDLRASETDIGELRLQEMDNDEEYLTFKYNILFTALSDDDAKGVLFFDEMNLAPNMIKAQFYKIINDGAVGDIPISDGVLRVSAGNEMEHARGVTEDPTPLVLRRANYFIRPLQKEEYTDYAVRNDHHKHIVGYLGFRPAAVHDIDYDKSKPHGQPCPRTWTKLSNILSNNDDLDHEDIEVIATGLIGQSEATKFAAYVKTAQDVELQEFLDNPELVKQYEDEEDTSLLYAIVSGVVDEFRDDKEVIEPAFEMSLHFEKPEFGAYLLRSLKQIDEKRFKKAGSDSQILDSDVANKVVDRYAKYLFKR